MYYTYQNCRNLTGSPVCGPNVTQMLGTYRNCSRLTGSPVCGPKVTGMSQTYENCRNLTGSPVCGPKVTDMANTYRDCHKLTGSPVFGPNVTVAAWAYYNSKNLAGNAYCYSKNLRNVYGMFASKNNSKMLNIYVPSNSNTSTYILNDYANASVVAARIYWANAGSYYYNTTYNIYIYPVANVAAAAIANGDEEANANAGITTGTNVPVHQ